MKLKFSLLLLVGLISLLNADKYVTKTVFVNQANYANKSTKEIKKILLDKAKMDAASEIFGDFIKSETDIENGRMIRNLIISEKNGIVHIKGEPLYANGKNFGDMQVTVRAYATTQDIKDMTIQKIEVSDFVYKNPNIAMSSFEKAAEDAFLVHALSQKKPALKNNPNQVAIARSLALSVNITSKTFSSSSATMVMAGVVEYIPFFLKNK